MRLTGQTIIGIIIIFIGLNILSSTLHLPFSFGQLFVPLLFLLLGGYFWQQSNRMIGGVLVLIGLINLGNLVFDINAAGLIIAVLMVYFGFRLFQQDRTSMNKNEEDWWSSDEEDGESEDMFKKHKQKKWTDFEEDIDREIEKISNKVKDTFHYEQTDNERNGGPSEMGQDHTADKKNAGHDAYKGRKHADQFKKAFTSHWKTRNQDVQQVTSFLGDFIQQDHQFELNDMQINHFIGDVKIDLSKAIIAEGLTTIEINAFIGDVHIYVPYDLEVDVQGNVLIGDMNGVTRKNGRRAAEDGTFTAYDDTKQIKIIASLFIGDIDVRYV